MLLAYVLLDIIICAVIFPKEFEGQVPEYNGEASQMSQRTSSPILSGGTVHHVYKVYVCQYMCVQVEHVVACF